MGDITPTVTTTERGPLMLRLRLSQRLSTVITVTPMVWDTTSAMLAMATLVCPTLMEALPPPTLPWDTLWLTPPASYPLLQRGCLHQLPGCRRPLLDCQHCRGNIK